MSMADAIHKALTGRERGGSGFGARLEDLVQQAGSGRKAAARLGVAESTLRRWRKGPARRERDQTAREAKFDRLYRAMTIDAATAARWRANDMTVTVHGVPGRGGGTRVLSAGQLGLASGTGAAVVDAFLRGDDRGAARAFRAGITDDWYRDIMFGDWIDDDDLRGEEYDGQDSDYDVSVGSAS